ncbi:MAG: OadG family protein [Proteobacteria bacterium]|nr:OadG family protein [Pseudomonadota bacterium]
MIKNEMRSYTPFKYLIISLSLLYCILLYPSNSFAVFGEDIEKPRPKFTVGEDKISAKFIPRAKSTSIIIDFKASGGKLVNVTGIDFEALQRPELDIKNYKSSFFEIKLENVEQDSEAAIHLFSNFFSGSTEFWLVTRNQKEPWINTEAQKIVHPDMVYELVVKAKDGGPSDMDGAIDGRITLLGGPKDSFWGYALGTLFIRFFGIFLVLGILMIGMIISGKVFSGIMKKKDDPIPSVDEKNINPKVAAAIAVALKIHLSAGKERIRPEPVSNEEQSTWSKQGSKRIMSDRSVVFNRHT